MPPRLLLGHGASGTATSMRPWVAALTAHGVVAQALDLPRSSPERAVGVFRDALASNPAAAIGGHSFGGRMASMLAAERAVDALVLLSYPLHRPGHPEELRMSHWPRIEGPVLFLSGDRDPFAKIDLLRRNVGALRNAELIVYPGIGHGLLSVREDAAERIAAFLGEREAPRRGRARRTPIATVATPPKTIASPTPGRIELIAPVSGVPVPGVFTAAVRQVPAGRAMSLLCRVTAPLRARTRPAGTFAPVVSVMLVRAMRLPWNLVAVPRVADEPTCQKTWHVCAPLVRRTTALLAVVSVLPILKMKTPLPLSVSDPFS